MKRAVAIVFPLLLSAGVLAGALVHANTYNNLIGVNQFIGYALAVGFLIVGWLHTDAALAARVRAWWQHADRLSERFPILTRPMLWLLGTITIQSAFLIIAWYTWDLPTADGAGYFDAGFHTAQALTLGSLQASPLFTLYYAIFHKISPAGAPFTIYYAHRAVVLLGITLFVFKLVERLAGHDVAFPITVLFTAFNIGIGTNIFVVHSFTLALLLGVFYLATFQTWYAEVGVLGGFVLLYFARPEYIVGLVVFGLWLVIRSVVKRRDYGQLAAAGIILAALVLLNITTESSGRSWVAFSQHYALAYQERTPDTPITSTWLYHTELTHQAFGTATSISEALRANPVELARHITWNVWSFPRDFAATLQPTPLVTDLWQPILFVSIVVSTGYVIHRRKPISRALAEREINTTLLLATASAAVLVSLIVMLLIKTRVAYMLGIVPHVLIILSLFLEHVYYRGRSATVLNGILLVMSLLFAGYTAQNAEPEKSNVAIVQAVVAARPPAEPFGLLSFNASSFCTYVDQTHCHPLNIVTFASVADVEGFLTEQSVEVIVLSAELAQVRFDAPMQAFVADLATNEATQNWRLHTETPYGARIFVRR